MLHKLHFVLPLLVAVVLCSSAAGASDSSSAGTAQITALLKNYVVETTDWDAAEIEVSPIGNLDALELPSGSFDVQILSGATFVGRSRILAPFRTVQNGKALRDFWVTADVKIRASVITASKKISYNETVSPEDVLETVVEIQDLRASYLRKPEDVIGKLSRRSFAPGTPLTRDSFTEPYLVRRGEIIQLRLERNGIALASRAKAEQDGKLGQIINVRNLQFSTSLKAQVMSRGIVQVP